MNTDNITPAHAAGLKRYRANGNSSNMYPYTEGGYYDRVETNAHYDALLQRHADESERATVLIANRDAAIEERDRQIAELVAVLKAVKNYEGYYEDVMEDPEISRRVVDLIDQHATPQAVCDCCNGTGEIGDILPNGNEYEGEPCPMCAQSDTTATADDDDAVIAWLIPIGQEVADWRKWWAANHVHHQYWRENYTAHTREQCAKGSES